MIGLLLALVLWAFGEILPEDHRAALGTAAAAGFALLLMSGRPIEWFWSVAFEDDFVLSGWERGQTIDQHKPWEGGGKAVALIWLGYVFVIFLGGRAWHRLRPRGG
jgi:hypothetical protein